MIPPRTLRPQPLFSLGEIMPNHLRTAASLSLMMAAMSFTAPQASGQIQIRPEDASGLAESLSAEQLVKVRLATDAPVIGPGQTIHLAAIFTIAPNWHIYWANPGDSGAPTNLTVTVPDGFTVGRTLFPRPMAFTDEIGTTYGYERQVVLFVPVTAPRDLQAGEIEFKVDVFYLVCRERCLMGNIERTQRVRAAAAAVRAEKEGPEGRVLRGYFQRLPRPLEELLGSDARLGRGRLTLTGPAHANEEIEFFPLPVPGVTIGKPDIIVEADRFRLVVTYDVQPQNALGGAMSVKGVLGLGKRGSDPCYHFELPLEGGG
jgi:thiol:disulfide interchange protein DsbD